MNRLENILRSNLTYIILTILILIYSFINIYIIRRESIYSKGNNTIIGKVKEISKNDNGMKIVLDSKENIILFYTEYINYNLGDKIKVYGELDEPNENSVFNLFSYKQYLYNEGIFYVMKANKIELISKNKNILIKIKSSIIKLAENRTTAAYLKAFILGDTSEIDNKVMKSYQSNGVSHLLAVSGMHISLITMLLDKVIKKKKIFIYIFIVFYMFLTNFSPSIMRAGIFFLLLSLNKKYKLNISTINVLLLTLFVSLIIDPSLITKIGFQYSFMISLFLIMSSNLFKNKSKILSLLLVSVIAFLASVPISINSFYQLNILSIIYNLIFVPLVSSIIFPLSLIAFIFKPLDIVLSLLIRAMETLSLTLSSIKIGILTFGKLNVIFVIIYYVLLVAILKNYKSKRNYIILFILLLILYNKSLFNNNFEVTFIDVGQGDSVFLKLPRNNGSILIDTGGNNSDTYSLGEDVISKYIKSYGIRKIDYLIITHGDYDHIGEAIEIVNSIKVKNVIFNEGNYNDLELQLINVLEKNKIKYYKCPKKIRLNKYNFYFLNTKDYNNENENSIVIYTEISNTKMLFMGDSGVEKEKDILNKYNISNIDILKVGHHGSNTSSSEYFINKITPANCFISVGKKNKFGHPKQSVLDILNSCNVYRTDINGSIKVKLNKNNYEIKNN